MKPKVYAVTNRGRMTETKKSTNRTSTGMSKPPLGMRARE